MEDKNKDVSELVKDMYKAGGNQKILKTKNLFLELAEAMFKSIDKTVHSDIQVPALEKKWEGKLAAVLDEGLEKESDTVINNWIKDLNDEQKKWLIAWGKQFVKTILNKCGKIKAENKKDFIITQVKKIFADVYKSYTSNGVWNFISGYWASFKKYCNNDQDFVEEAYYNCQEDK